MLSPTGRMWVGPSCEDLAAESALQVQLARGKERAAEGLRVTVADEMDWAGTFTQDETPVIRGAGSLAALIQFGLTECGRR